MSQNFMEILSGLVEVVGTSLINAIAQLSDIIGGLAQALSGLIDFVTGVLQGIGIKLGTELKIYFPVLSNLSWPRLELTSIR